MLLGYAALMPDGNILHLYPTRRVCRHVRYVVPYAWGHLFLFLTSGLAATKLSHILQTSSTPFYSGCAALTRPVTRPHVADTSRLFQYSRWASWPAMGDT